MLVPPLSDSQQLPWHASRVSDRQSIWTKSSASWFGLLASSYFPFFSKAHRPFCEADSGGVSIQHSHAVYQAKYASPHSLLLNVLAALKDAWMGRSVAGEHPKIVRRGLTGQYLLFAELANRFNRPSRVESIDHTQIHEEL
ncbi:hypothetical protein JDV02_001187 [Purpureocillium takamizusanense]|uniref:Uncharacterized protein n=1 Tax=Purpureocillium takamizusanense TaxID=2060973 RepID=A0A9Q8V7L3_9HYPO|nr:uncharacterized protein JDV02_001187 [Purpureocillium takamizusanense]UNI14571.1 hypothetical protein JDV02_001187 [Purpureocillium takamizusanense]